jgi:hypothetical protein
VRSGYREPEDVVEPVGPVVGAPIGRVLERVESRDDVKARVLEREELKLPFPAIPEPEREQTEERGDGQRERNDAA